jgi:uncharacterized membrane protein YagU involved in acid resistance
MNLFNAILSGLAGTLVMTALMYMAPAMGMPKMDIIGMLGTMFTPNQGTARLMGIIAHFMMGAVFAIIYALLWGLGIGSPIWLWGVIFGAGHGVVAMLTMPMMVKMHPRPTRMDSGPMMRVGLWDGLVLLSISGPTHQSNDTKG